jgi:uncharacterized protein (TIGR04255 family)
MAKITQLTNAPITEAIIDFRIEPEKEFPLDKLSELKNKIGGIYPKHEPRNLIESRFEIEPSQRQISQSTKEKGLYGFFFKSEDEKTITQFRVNGFTFNRLKPYTSWDMIFSEAKRLWNFYVDIICPELVTRIAVRYINHMNLPLTAPVEGFSRYLTAPPPVPGDLPKKY